MELDTTRKVKVRGDITGNVYGDLTVVGLVGVSTFIKNGVVKANGTVWSCKCSCGNTRNVYKSHLTCGLLNSCGCKNSSNISSGRKISFTVNGIARPRIGYYDRSANIKDITGNVYGDLTVIELVGSKLRMVNGRYRGCGSLWRCKCACGNTVVKVGGYLNNPKFASIASCGCKTKFHRVKGALKRGYSTGVAAKRLLYGSYKHNAEKFGRVWELTMEEFVGITSSNCYYCGKVPSQTVGGRDHRGSYTYNGIDRKNNLGGYSKDNAVPCCKVCNQMKHAFPYEVFLNKVKEIYYKHSSFYSKDDCEYCI